MKNLSFKFVFITLVVFSMISLALYVLNVPVLLVPVFSTVFTLFYSEKKVKHRMFYLFCAFVVYSQFSTPLPLPFLIFVSVQIYLLTVSFFASTAFDFSLTALLNSILSAIVITFYRSLYLYVFTGSSHIVNAAFSILFSSVILIFFYNIFKPSVDTLFTKDSWL